MAVIMDAKPLFEKIKEEVKAEVNSLKENGIMPVLVSIIVNEDAISHTYVFFKQKDCEDVGIRSEIFDLSKVSAETREHELIGLIKKLNERSDVHGILIQLPFPNFVSEEKVFETLSPAKDVDGLTPYRLGKFLRGEYDIDSDVLPCTPKGVIKLLDYYNVNVASKDVAIIGRSVLVSNPLRKLLEDRDATATCYHTKSKDVHRKIKEADIVIAAAGRPPEMYKENSFRLTGDMIKEGAVVVCIGVRKDLATGNLYFDVDFNSVKDKASHITPNVGGIGLMTRAMLLKNTIIACKNLCGL